ncbi:MAG: hypothetical protein ABF636_10375 [Acetobacter sp.]|uniref:hypothetical protein n=1 Tax=Acetobacter sp. TaxID=440 RepID=UPI0039EBDB4D
MAYYKDINFLDFNTGSAFDAVNALSPGDRAEYAGIYRCTGCGHEIAIAKGHIMPPQNHHSHGLLNGPILWQLIVAAKH